MRQVLPEYSKEKETLCVKVLLKHFNVWLQRSLTDILKYQGWGKETSEIASMRLLHMCICVYRCTHMCTCGAQSLQLGALLNHFLPFVYGLMLNLGPTWVVNPRNHSASAPKCWDYRLTRSCPRVLILELRAPWLHREHFTDWAILQLPLASYKIDFQPCEPDN